MIHARFREASLKPCPNCQRDIEDTTLICPYCGSLIATDSSSTRALGNTDVEDGIPRWGTARFNDRMNLVLRLRDSRTTFVYDAEQITELLIGRRDPTNDKMPDLDLDPYGGADKGVSRNHAAIVRRDGALSVVDKGGANGTFLNGQRLIPHQPRILRDGDDLRLGHMVLQVRFERVIADGSA
jgi:pSer/pThr/pTyr-binding forkhead associated (FHA) protein